MMTEQILDISRNAFKVCFLLSAPILLSGLLVGVAVNVFQAVTQISEATLSLVPKIFVMLLVFVLLAPWYTDILTDFTIQMFETIPGLVR